MLAESQALKSLQQFQFKRMQVIYTNGNPLLQIQLKPQLSTAAYCISISLQFLQSNQILRNCFENLDQLKHYLCQNPSKLQIVRKVDIILNITMLTKHHQIVLPVCQIQNGKAQAMNQQKIWSQVDLKTKQFKKAVRKLLQNHEPNKVFQRLVGALGMAFGDPKKIQKTYGLIGLLNMVPSIKISQPYYCVDKQMVVLLLDFIKQGKLLFQALWMLINGSTGHLHYRIWLEKGATQMFLGFLDSNEVKIVELALHGIFKLAYDYRDKILELGAIYKIITTLQRFDHRYTELADNGFRALYNILRRRPLLRYEVAETVLVKIIIGITDQLIQDSFVQKQCIICLSEYLEPMHQNIISKIASFQKFACLLESDDQYLFPATCKIITAAIVSQLQSIQKLSISCLLDPLVEHLKNEKRVIRITGQRRECKEITIKKRAFALVYTLACSSKNIHEILAHKDLMCALLTQGIFNDYPPNINEIVPQFFYNILVKGQYPQVYECLKNIPIMSYLYRLCFSQSQNTSFQIGMQILSNVLAFEEWCQFEGQKHLANQLHNMVRGDLNRILNDCSSKGRKCKRLIHRFLSLYPQQKNSAKSSRMYIQQKHSG